MRAKKVWRERTQVFALVTLLALIVAWALPVLAVAMGLLAVVAGATSLYPYWRYRQALLRELDEALG